MTTIRKARGGRRWRGRGAPLLVAILVAVAAPGSVAGVQEVEERRDVASDATIRIHTQHHDVEVETWDRSEVWVRAQLNADGERLEVFGTDRTLDIQVLRDPPSGRRSMAEGALRIQLPREARIEVQTVSGRIQITDARGTVNASSVSGVVRVTGSARVAAVNSVSGSITLESQTTDIRANSVSGSVRVVGGGGRIEAHAVSGSLVIEPGQPVTSAHFRSVSGPIRFEGALASNAALSAESHSGRVELRLHENVGATIRANSLSGTIRNELTADQAERPRFGPGSSLRATIGDGSAQVDVQSFSGSLLLLWR